MSPTGQISPAIRFDRGVSFRARVLPGVPPVAWTLMLGEHAVMIGAQIVPVVWSQRLHRVKTYCLSQSYLSFTLTARTTGRDNAASGKPACIPPAVSHSR